MALTGMYAGYTDEQLQQHIDIIDHIDAHGGVDTKNWDQRNELLKEQARRAPPPDPTKTPPAPDSGLSVGGTKMTGLTSGDSHLDSPLAPDSSFELTLHDTPTPGPGGGGPPAPSPPGPGGGGPPAPSPPGPGGGSPPAPAPTPPDYREGWRERREKNKGGRDIEEGAGRMVNTDSNPTEVGAGAGQVMSGIGSAIGGSFGAVLGPVGMFVQGLFEAIGAIKDWIKELHEANMKFAQFSAGMADVAAQQLTRELELNMARGERRAETANELAESMHGMNVQWTKIEDRLANGFNKVGAILGEILEAAAKILNEMLDDDEDQLPGEGQTMREQAALAQDAYDADIRRFAQPDRFFRR